MTFNTEIIACTWNEEAGQWTVKLRQTHPDSAPREFEEKCDLLLHATGILNNFKWPEIEGLEKFKGKVVHTARWPKDTKKNSGKTNQSPLSDLVHHRSKLCQPCSPMSNT